MAVSTFAVVYGDIQSLYFPSSAAFSGSTKPTSTSVTTMISQSAARVAGALKAVGLSAATLSTDAGATYPAAYASCQHVIMMGAAIAVYRAMAGQLPTGLLEEYEAWFTRLSELGAEALGDAPVPSNLPFRSHVVTDDLDTGDVEDSSDAVPEFRASDKL